MPRIFPARSRTSSTDLATLTPPALPRPPAWICAFTTQTLPPSVCAALTASSTEKAGMPRGVGMPKRRKISLPWYSWIFTRFPQFPSVPFLPRASAGASIPPRIELPHRVASRLEGMAGGGVEGVGLGLLDFGAEGGEHLNRGGGQVREQLGDVAAAAHAAHRVVERLAKAVQEAGADEFCVRRLDPIAGA